MSCVSIHQMVRRNRVHNLWSNVARVAIVTLLCCAPHAAYAQTGADFEQPPVLAAKDLVAEKLLTGKGVRIEDQVPTDGVMETFTIHADADTIEVTASVKAINYKKRTVTLEGPEGNARTLKVDKEVKELKQVKKGDEVVVWHTEAVAIVVRKPE